jgi:signal transduction histidine kinase/CheY-like chemotaxis protein/purine-cytosine permease-like protein
MQNPCRRVASEVRAEDTPAWLVTGCMARILQRQLVNTPLPPTLTPAADTPAEPGAWQRITLVRRDYNGWVASETMEDYALRFTPQSFRKWSEWRVANTAFGAASFLILEAVGATLLVQYGFVNAFWAILATGLIIFLAGLPISIYAARFGVDMDLLTRGAGFGYIGSTITSLIYASFTFIFFALEAAVMAYALELCFGVPPRWGYLICALAVIPLVMHGVSAISRLQVWTQPLWLILLVVPFVYVMARDPQAFAGVVHYVGDRGVTEGFSLPLFGAALTVGVALMTQMGEQADYLRFMPARTQANQRRWWFGVLAGGPGWVVLGVLKMLGGALLAYLAISHAVPADRAVDPNQMYLAAYEYVFPHYGWAVAATALFVVLSQLKINVTNAYAGSLAWSNFFSRLTHSHPGRVVWVVFNTLIALMLMEMNVFAALGDVLGLFSNIAIAWMMAVVADLVISKPLGLSPPGIEFKRAHLYDINPVGVGAMALASILSVTAHLGSFGPMAQAFSAVIAMTTAFVASPLIAWATQGKYYLARKADPVVSQDADHTRYRLQKCVICQRDYEAPDMAHCPAYQGAICSLCCTLDARCGDLCKPHASLGRQWQALLRWLLPRPMWTHLDKGLGTFLMLMLVIAPLLASVFGLLYHQEMRLLLQSVPDAQMLQASQDALQSGFAKAFMALMLISGLVTWWVVLAHQSRQVAQEESNRQTQLLLREIELHRQTDLALQLARQVAEQARLAADQANQAKSRYISAISHELRTPLNSILGYAQLMGEDASIPAHRKQAVNVIKRGGEHLLSLIEGTLDIAHIESGKLTLNVKPMHFAELVHDIASLFELEAQAKGLAFNCEIVGRLPPVVRADEKRVRQILINLLGNAIKFTAHGHVTLRLRHAREMATLEIEDTGPGLSVQERDRIFEPFTRAHNGGATPPGAGLGLTIAKMLTDLMGGEMTVTSTLGQGSVFRVKLFLPEVPMVSGATVYSPASRHQSRLFMRRPRLGYAGARRRILVVDNEEADRELLVKLLQPIGFELRTAASGHDCLDLLATGYLPDVMLMDLAMPGIDGWETIRRARALLQPSPHPLPQVAIVSANAFDRGLDNDVGIPAEDFILKPVRHADLLDWLEIRLGLVWLETAPAPVTAKAPSGDMVYPDRAQREALRELVTLGYYRGILNQLDDIERLWPQCAEFVSTMRDQAKQFQFETMLVQLGSVANEA